MKTLLAVVVCVAVAAPALADDYLPPEWRGMPNTTLQKWEFYNDMTIDVLPEPGWGNPLPSTMIKLIEPDPAHPFWIPEDDASWFGSGRVGIWPLSGWMDVMVDNFPDPNDWKVMWIQLTWHESISGARPQIEGIMPAFHSKEIVFETVPPLCSDWIVTVWEVWIMDNPPDELFHISGDVLVDELVVDTWCMPEPATLGLLSLGGLAMAARRRRRR